MLRGPEHIGCGHCSQLAAGRHLAAVLVSADDDHRIIVRPRGPEGYDVPLVDVTL